MLQDQEHLELSKRHLAEAAMRVDRQQQLIHRLEAHGHATALAEELLASLVETKRQMQTHHDYLENRTKEV